jgi:hypothetical protein
MATKKPDHKAARASLPQASDNNVSEQGSTPVAAADLVDFIRRLAAAGGLPVALSQAPPPRIDTALRLSDKPRLTVAFPPCTEELLALLRATDTDEITEFFNEYFAFEQHRILGQDKNGQELDTQLGTNLDPDLLGCLDGGTIFATQPRKAADYNTSWPTECCLCPPCVTLNGNRNPPLPPHTTEPQIRRLFIGDAVWLYYFERMGINQILGVILDAYACTGTLPISNGSIEAGVRDDIVALVLEVMVRQTKMGMSSTVRDRACLFRTALGWVNDGGRKLGVDSEVNTGFNVLFNKFIYHALEFYRDKRLAIAIQGAAGGVAPPSVATLITISETLEVLKKRFEAFDYGRNYYNTLSGIIWAIAGMAVVRELRTTLGIPPAFGDAHEFIPAAYDLLVLKRAVTHGETNRFIVHRDCARNGRDVLLDLEVIDHLDTNPGGELENWVTQIEAKVESYRTAYRTLTGIDLGASATPMVEQQA